MGKKVKNMETEILRDEVVEEVTESPAPVETNGSPKTRTGVVILTSYVRVRQAASMESEVLEVLRGGDKVVILGKKNGFYEVKTSNNPIGYISSDFLKEE